MSDLLRRHAPALALVLLFLLATIAAGGVAYCERTSEAREVVAALQDTVDRVRERRRADSARADRLEGRVKDLRAAVAAASRATRRAVEETRATIDSLEERREEARVAGARADSAFRALGDSAAALAGPRVRELVRRRTSLHVEAVEAREAEVEVLERQAEARGRVTSALREENRALHVLADSLREGWAAERQANASLREELRLTREQRDRLDEALDVSFLGDFLRSPLTHATAAGIGFAAGLAAR